MRNRLLIEDDEKKDILSQHDDIDQKILNFLIRRIKVEEKDLGTDWFDKKQLKVTEYSFDGLPGYGFNSYVSKKRMETKILDMDSYPEWLTTRFEVVNNTLIYPSKSVDFNELAIVYRLEFNVRGITTRPLILRNLSLASQVLNDNSFKLT